MPPRLRPVESDSNRVIVHIDMDCFYVQVEQRRRPTLRGVPTAVVQYNSWQGGGLIAVGYEARAFGVKRSMRGDEAKRVCPDIQLVQVPVARGKADLSIYRNAGSEVVSILSKKGRCERASIDEVYLDLSEAAQTLLSENPFDSLESISVEALKSHVLGLRLVDGADVKDRVREWFMTGDANHGDKLLACGALIVAQLRLDVLKETEFTCSAGIAHNKMLAKLASGMNKPAQQTVVPLSAVKEVLDPLPIKKMKQLGGKLGTSLQDDLGLKTIGDLLQFSEEKLQERYGVNTGTWLWNIARGVCAEEVQDRLLPKSHGSGKTFPGTQALKTISTVQNWLNDLCEELNERLLCDLEQNKRIAHTLTLHASAHKLNDSESFKKFPSKSCPLRYGIAKIQEDALNLFNAGLRDFIGFYNVKATGNKHPAWAITGLSVTASKIVERPSGTHSIMKYFHNMDQQCTSTSEQNVISNQNVVPSTAGNESCERSHVVDHPHSHAYEGEIRTKDDMQTHEDEGEDKDVHCTAEKADRGVKHHEGGNKDEFLPSSSGAGLGSTSLTDSKIDFRGPAFKTEQQKRKFDKEKGTPSILRFFSSQNSIPEQTHVEETGAFSETEQQKRKFGKEKGTPSILRFFSSQNSIPDQTHVEETGAFSADFQGSSCPENVRPKTGVIGKSTSGNTGHNDLSDAWRYKSDEIDPTVLNELPREIQAEVRAWLQPHKRANTEKRGSSIAHYFAPATNT